MKVLLHSCCAPCTTFPLYLLRSLGHTVDGVFHNPNIHPPAERDKRLSVYTDFAGSECLNVRTIKVDGTAQAQAPCLNTLAADAPAPDPPHQEWLRSISSNLNRPARCRLCYLHRLLPVAELARQEGYDCFTTSLLLSIYQDHGGIVEAAEEASSEAAVPFLYMDFRVGYRRSREISRGRHLYMQKYCGCEFSAGEGPGPGAAVLRR